MAKREKAAEFLQGMTEISTEMQTRDREVSVRRDHERGELGHVAIERIRLRESDTRPLNHKHVASLVESISALGLLEPLVVDQERVLLAGAHRLSALTYIQQERLTVFNKHFPTSSLPVRLMPFVAADTPERALQVEIAENEHRRDYTPSEVRHIANHLRNAGYKDVKGRPKKGDKALMPALSVVIGKNIRTVQRYLSDHPEKSVTDVMLFLKKARKALLAWEKKSPSNKENEVLMAQIPGFIDLIDDVLAKNKTPT